MIYRKKTSVKTVEAVTDHNRLAHVFTLLIAIDKRMNAQQSNAKKAKKTNDGHSYRWRCNSYEVIFYDKIRDLEYAKKSAKRSLEHDSALQQHIFKKLEKRNKLEFLRMEVRLNKRTKIKQLFKELNITADLTLKKLFKPAIAKKVLLYYVNELESKRFALLEYKPRSDKALLADLVINSSKASVSKILQLFGLKKALETVTLRELRNMFSKYNKRSWYRLIADVHNVKLPAIHNAFETIRDYIIKFKPTKLPSIFK